LSKLEYQVVTNIDPGQSITLTWTVTPVATGSGILLRVSAVGGDLLGVNEHPMVVNEPGTLPNLTLAGTCGLSSISPGEAISLSVYVMDEYLRVLTDTSTVVSATLYAIPTAGFSTTVQLPPTAQFPSTVQLPYCESCGRHQTSVTIPITTPVGNYRVDFVATRVGYDPDQETSYFFVKPSLGLVVTASHTSAQKQETVTLTAQVTDRDMVVTRAGVRAELITPGGVFTLPLTTDGELYTLSFRPVDLVSPDEQIVPGNWKVRVTADYLGSKAAVEKEITVWRSVYLPLVLRQYR
jgi:hypothetical protein